MLVGRGDPQGHDSNHGTLPLCRLEKEYAAMKSKEMEEQIEIKVSPGARGAGTGMGGLWGLPPIL